MEEGLGARHGGLPELCPTGGGADLISALPDDLVLHVLARLRCARAAVRTSLLSRRWSRIWRRLAGFTFRDVPPRLLRPALNSLVDLPDVFLLDIHVSEALPPLLVYHMGYVADVGSVFRAAARLSPVELRFKVSRCSLARLTRDDLRCLPGVTTHVDLPCLHRATSIDLCGLELSIPLFADAPASSYMFPALEVLSLSGCHADAAALLRHCPGLRVLKATDDCFLGDTICSASLEELVLENKRKLTGRLHIEVPAVKQLTLSINIRGELRLTILAPMVEKVLWQCSYSKPAAGIGLWGLAMVRLETESNALSLWMESDDSLGPFSFPHTELSLSQELEKYLMATNFSVLDLHFNTTGHAFGAFVFPLLRVHWIRTATKSLKIGLGEKAIACPVSCLCDERKNWRSETISLINLEEVEIRAFGGEDHEFDFLKLILKCAPRLIRMAIRLSHEVTTSNDCNAKIYDVMKAYPSVRCSCS